MQVPVGFRFHPTDEELVAHYLHGKIASTSSCNRSEALEIIRDLDLYRLEPWDLHGTNASSYTLSRFTTHHDLSSLIIIIIIIIMHCFSYDVPWSSSMSCVESR
jgi:hypothetical protein